jgi:hypothetical protein
MTKTSFRIRNLALALAVAAGTAGVMAGPALADDWGHRGWDRDHHEEHWRPAAHRVYYAPPAPAYVAPVVPYAYAAPAPVAPFSLNLVLPLRFN